MGKSLFSNRRVGDYFAANLTAIKNSIGGFAEDKILSIDFNEWVEYYYSKYYIDAIKIFDESIKKTLNRKKIQRSNIWAGAPGESEFVLVDGYELIYEIPFDGDHELLYLTPDTRYLKKFIVESFVRPQRDELGSFCLNFQYTEQQIKDQKEVDKYIEKEFLNEFKYYKETISRINSEVVSFNNTLKDYIMKQLNIRKEQASNFNLLSEKLNIPLALSEDAPNITPIPLKRIKREPPKQPEHKKVAPEYAISDTDYKNIINIIHSSCTAMEATARTHCKFEEEELRDSILATLNTHYDGVTGEAFRKVGKTDIHIIFENKAAYIGECKIWHGIKEFKKAVSQLFSYSTWKDTKMSLIVFNKENKDFKALMQTIEEWASENSSNYSHNANTWQCKLEKPDTNDIVNVNIGVYDLMI